MVQAPAPWRARVAARTAAFAVLALFLTVTTACDAQGPATGAPTITSAPATASALPALPAKSVLDKGQSIQDGATLGSPNGQFTLNMQTDGNLVALMWPKPYWALGTHSEGAKLQMQTDGNLVMYSKNGGVVWASGTYDPSGGRLILQDDGNLVLDGYSKGLMWSPNAVPTRLYANQKLVGNQDHTIYSPDRRYKLTMQHDGNVVAYDRTTAIWSKHGAKANATLEMQTDANLVLYDSTHTAIWATNKFGSSSSYLEAQNDGNFVVYDRGTALWSTKSESPDVGGTGASRLISGSDRDLAQRILASKRVTGDSRYINQIKAYAAGNTSCHINPTILSLIYTTVAPTNVGGLNRTVYISSLNRYCTKVITKSGKASYHYTRSGGHAVDFAMVNGKTSTGATKQDLALLRQVLPLLPKGSGIGQVDCRKYKLVMPAGVTQFSDSCNHNHFQVPIR